MSNNVVPLTEEERTKHKIPTTIGLFGAYLTDSMDIVLLSITLPFIITEWGLTLTQAGWGSTATVVSAIFSSFTFGWIADKKGRKPAVLSALFVVSILTGAIYWVQDWTVFVAIRFISGIAMGAMYGTIGTWLREVWPVSQLGLATGATISSVPLASLIIAQVAKYQIPTVGWQFMYLWGFAGLIFCVYILFFVPESKVFLQQKAEKAAKQDKGDAVPALAVFKPEYIKITLLSLILLICWNLSYYGIMAWVPTFLKTERNVSTTLMANFVIFQNLGMFTAYYILGWLERVLGRNRMLFIIFLLGGGATILVPFIHNTAILFSMAILIGMAFATGAPLLNMWSSQFPPEIRASGVSLIYTIGRSCSAFSPILMGIIATATSLGTAISIVGVLFCFCAVFPKLLPQGKYE